MSEKQCSTCSTVHITIESAPQQWADSNTPQHTHVCQNAVEVVVVQGDHPLQPDHLVLPQLSPLGPLQQAGRLGDGLLYCVSQGVVPALGV